MSEKETLAVYDARASDYEKIMQAQDDPMLEAFIAALPDGGAVLDLGCGPGLAAARMAEAGLDVVATDGSAEMVRLAQRHPGVQVRQATFDDIEGTDIYDGVWANFSLLHAPRADFPGHLAALHTALKPAGVLHIAVKLGDGEGPDTIGRHYTYYSEDGLKEHLAKAGFTPVTQETGEGAGLSGEVASWIAIRAHA